MRPASRKRFPLGFAILTCLLLFQLFQPNNASLSNSAPSLNAVSSLRPLQSSSIQLLGPNSETIPVVNTGGQIQLQVTDASGNPITGATFQSGSPEIATIDAQTGMVTGVKEGYTTITAQQNGSVVSAFVQVVLVGASSGKPVSGDTEVDTSGAVYITDPDNNIVYKRDTADDAAVLFAGQMGVKGNSDAERLKASFAAPTAVAVDNRSQGGIYIADTLNHSIRKISFSDSVATVLNSSGAPGTITADSVPFAMAAFRGPQGVAVDSGGNLYIADTENHAIYVADFSKNEVRLLAGSPGVSGKANGQGRKALFSRPTAISVQSTTTSFFGSQNDPTILVADTGNGRIRRISLDGTVTTVGKIQSTSFTEHGFAATYNQTASTEFSFTNPRSVSIDGLGNIYVVDDSGVKVLVPVADSMELTTLAPTSALGNPMSVVINGNQAVVLDRAASDTKAIKVVTTGQPSIAKLSDNASTLDGNEFITITGKNFAPESVVVLGDTVVTDAIVDSATQIRIRVPRQKAPGQRTLSIQTRGGTAQSPFNIVSPLFSSLNAGEITTIAGGIPFLGDGGSVQNANLRVPRSIAIDGNRNLYISDSAHNRIRKVDPSGTITTVAGTGTSGVSSDGGPAISASLDLLPSGAVAIDTAGNLLIAETTNNRVRKVNTSTGIITTVAGTGEPGFAGDNGPATSALLSFPDSIAVDNTGNIYIADSNNHRIRRIDAQSGIIITVVGTGKGAFGGDNGPATAAALNLPRKVLLDKDGNILIADTNNHRVRLVDARTGIIRTVAGNGNKGFSGDGGMATNASLSGPLGLALGPDGILFVADSGNNRIRKVDLKNSSISTIVGGGMPGMPKNGDDGPANRAFLSNPQDLVIDGTNNLLIVDSNNSVIRAVNRNGTIKTIVGSGMSNFSGDGGPVSRAGIDIPFSGGVISDRQGNIFFIDQTNNRIRKIDRNGIITTVAGNGQMGFSGDGGPATSASITMPFGITIDPLGNLIIADTGNHRIRRVDRSGIINTIVGTGMPGFNGDGGPATSAMLMAPMAVAADRTSGLLIADSGNNRIRQVDLQNGMLGNIRTIAGNGTKGFGGDGGPGPQASFNGITSLITDPMGNLIICDQDNNRIRMLDGKTGMVRTIVGNGMPGFSGDNGLAIKATLRRPVAVALDDNGDLLISDSFNHRIRRVKAGMIRTIAGSTRGFSGDGEPAIVARLNKPTGVSVDGEGNLLISDTDNNAIRVVKDFDRAEAIVDYQLVATPDTQIIPAGNSTSFTVSINALNRFALPVELKAQVEPPTSDISVSFSPPTLMPGGESTVTITTTANTKLTTFEVDIIGKAGMLERDTDVNLVITRPQATGDFNLSASPISQMIQVGQSTNYQVNISPTGSFSQAVALNATLDQTNTNISFSFSNISIPVSGMAILTASTTSDTPPGTYNITITGNAGTLVHSQSVTLVVNDVTNPTPTTPMIANASFTKPVLTINGSNFSMTGAQVSVNSQDVTAFINAQNDTQITLRGNKKKLKLKRGENQLFVTINGTVSNTVTFNF